MIALLNIAAALVSAARGIGRNALEDIGEKGAERG